MSSESPVSLAEKAANGDRRSLARLISLIEQDREIAGEVMQSLASQAPVSTESKAWNSMAITGAPGVGKSCIIDHLLRIWASAGIRVALLAVDPSSPRTGGALLGDRIRMSSPDDESIKSRVYVRSIATRKAGGSVPDVLGDLITVLLALGWDRVLIETVGAGQSEIRCAAIAERIVIIEGPARGDGIQAEKAGLLELADAVVVNKSDLPGASRHAEELRESYQYGKGSCPPVLLASALKQDHLEQVAETLIELNSTGRAEKARWRERILALHERTLLENPKWESTLESLMTGELDLQSALEGLNDE